MASDDSEDFDFLGAIIKIPKGESLSPSRRTEGWDSSLVHGAGKLSHAEIRLTGKKDESEADSRLSDGQKIVLGVAGGVATGGSLVVLAYKYGPKLKQWWRSRRAKLDRVEPEVEAASSELVTEPVLVESTEEVSSELAESGVRMSDTERLARFLAMLAVEDFQNEQRRILASAVVEDEGYVLEAQKKFEELSPAQRVDLINFLSDRHPSLLDAKTATILTTAVGLGRTEGSAAKHALSISKSTETPKGPTS
jgi:hypothetical protein